MYQGVNDMKRLKMGGLCLNAFVSNARSLKRNSLNKNRETSTALSWRGRTRYSSINWY